MRYVLIDIDGTLTAGGEGGGAGSAALNLAFEELFAVSSAFDNVRKAGKTDPIIAREGFEHAGVPYTDEAGDRFRERYLLHLGELIRAPERRAHVLPGVVNLLDTLRRRDDTVLGLLTGNWMLGARIKLGSVALDGYFESVRRNGNGDGAFRFGAFGEDAPTRPELVPVAWKRFREGTGVEATPADTVLIGDTPRDVECAHVNGVRALAVTTGPFDADALRAAKADLIMPNLSATDDVISFLLD